MNTIELCNFVHIIITQSKKYQLKSLQLPTNNQRIDTALYSL